MEQQTMSAEEIVKERLDALKLSSEAVDMKPVDYSWSDHEFGEEWEVAAEVRVCPKCKGEGEQDCPDCADEDGQVACSTCQGSGEQDCPDCGGTGTEECETCRGDGCSECDEKGTVDCETCLGSGAEGCNNCDGEGQVDCENCDGTGKIDCDYEGCNEGELDEDWDPMMDYYYPLPSSFQVPEGVAALLDNTTLIYFPNERRYALALTGGGMDLSWQICNSYINLGYLPPIHFIELPRMAQHHGDRQKLIVAACKKSAEIRVRDGQWLVDRLAQMQKDIEAGRL